MSIGPGPVRRGRVLRRHARLQPARRQLAVGPAGVRPPVPGSARRSTSTASAACGPRSSTTTSTPREERALLPFSSATDGGENPFKVQLELQKTMHELVGIIRKADEMQLALEEARGHRDAHPHRVGRRGTASSTRAGTWRWTCATCCWCRCASAKAALERQESRGGHTRDDFPVMDADWRHVLLVLRALGEDDVELVRQEQVADAAGPVRPVRARRAEEVLHRRRAGRTPREEARR